jgi:hypothetical protein
MSGRRSIRAIRRALLACAGLLAAACDAGSDGEVGVWEPDSGEATSDALNRFSLSLHELRCDGDCLEVQARVGGGNPPYTLQWDDGSTDGRRLLCPQPDRETISVTGSDSPVEAFGRTFPGATITTSVRARCPGSLDGCTRGRIQRNSGECEVLPVRRCRDPNRPDLFSLRLPFDLVETRTYCFHMVGDDEVPVMEGAVWGAATECEMTEDLYTSSALWDVRYPGSVACLQPAAGTYSQLTLRLRVPPPELAEHLTFSICERCPNPQ